MNHHLIRKGGKKPLYIRVEITLQKGGKLELTFVLYG